MDMFLETIFTTWLSNAAPGKGIIFRLQGFGMGVFGGNHHTTNVLTLPPGLDVVCYSCGEDYVRGWRHLVKQARKGRMIMSVDSTNLLNKRHLLQGDDLWRRVYPAEEEEMHMHSVIKYEPPSSAAPDGQGPADTAVNDKDRRVLVVTYGNGVAKALEAGEELREQGVAVTVVDSPLISEVPNGLRQVLSTGCFDKVVFADECKQGQHPFAGFVCQLKAEDYLPHHWECVTAVPTYNPLGSTTTFLSKDNIVAAVRRLVKL